MRSAQWRVVRGATIALCVLGALPQGVTAQTDVEALGQLRGGATPPPGYYQTLRRLPNAFQFSADNGWVRRGRAVAAARGLLRAAGGAGAPAGPEGADVNQNGVLRGVLVVPVFLVMYANTDSLATVTNLSRDSMDFRVFGTHVAPPYSVHSFYREISNDSLLVNGVVFDWRSVSRADSLYEGQSNGLDNTGDVAGLIREIVLLHDAAVDYGLFDNDGRDGLPNSGDDDGYVDAIVLFHPEVGAECRQVNPVAQTNIWAHRFTYRGWTGGDLATADPSAAGGTIKIRDYIIQGGQGGATGCTSDQPQAMGVVAHETGHLFGLPDLYDTGGSSSGIGRWGIMGSGNQQIPTSPAHMEAWSRAELGWVTEARIDRDTTLVISPIATSDTAYVIPVAGSDEYFLLENRQRLGSDANLSGPGLLVWHVDSALIRERSVFNAVNASLPHGLALEQADGLDHLQSRANRGDAGDPFPGTSGQQAFTHLTSPSSARNDGTLTYLAVDQIGQLVPNGAMQARISFAKPSVIAARDTLAAFRLDGVTFNRFDDVLEKGTPHQLSIDATQVANGGRNRYTWVAWSNGQPREHTFISSATGDTITADVDVDFLLEVAAAGQPGSVAAAPTLDVTGAFVRQDSIVTLTATAADQGHFFDGWSGDTTSTANPLVVRMSRPFRLTASFAAPLANDPQTPPDAVMGGQYQHSFTASGGTGSYTWQLAGGTPPPGLTLSGRGLLSGRPTESGTFTFDIRVTSGSQTADGSVALTVVVPALVVETVVRHLVGVETVLSADETGYLDMVGNRNSRFDVGDFLAWMDQTGGAVSAAMMQAVLEAADTGTGAAERARPQGRPR